MSTNYAIIVEKYAERHFISNFRKKYRGAWDVTWKSMQEEFKRIDALIGETNIVETITDQDGVKICKTEFRIHNTQESRHSSGNRCIIAVHRNTYVVNVLVVYHKNDLGSSSETSAWKSLIRENYSEYSKLI